MLDNRDAILPHRDGRPKRFRTTTKKHLTRCGHCGMVVDSRFWADHREIHRKLQRKEKIHA